jgi:asparagine synthase (glutamine-hydrolysing)
MVDKIFKKHHIVMCDKYSWKLYERDSVKVWFSGYQYNNSFEDMIGTIISMLCSPNFNKHEVFHLIRNISGHFAIVVETNTWVMAAVDKICTVPIFLAECRGVFFISNHAHILKKECNIRKDELNLLASLEVSMSGYTIGDKTLYHRIKRLEGGTCLLYSQDKGSYYKEYYYTYSPWKTKDRSEDMLIKEFTDICTNTLVDLKKSANGRQIVIPLSAGNDSRLVASGLKEIGVKNVICFSYGRKGNFETPIGKIVAEKLGYKWIYIPVTMRGKRNFFKSAVYHKYIKDFESYSSIPNIHEVYEISLLRENPLIDDDAIIVNGNCGDFISGGHIKSMSDIKYTTKTVKDINWSKFLSKHYSLWEDLRNSTNDNYIVPELEKLLLSRINGELVDFEKYHYAMMECVEFFGRQSRFVANQQRTYEYFGYEWRLPLWSDEMFDFWESVPYKYKINQYLYIKALQENNWGDVWHNIKVNNKVIKPIFLRWTRYIARALFFFLGKEKWHRFEKKFFEYWLHPTYALTATSYLSVLLDRRKYRSANSWVSYKMLKSNGIKDIVNR